MTSANCVAFQAALRDLVMNLLEEHDAEEGRQERERRDATDGMDEGGSR